MKTIQVIVGEVEGRRRIKLVFNFDRELIGMVRSLPGCLWSKAMRCWHVADTQANMNRISDLFIDRGRFVLMWDTVGNKGPKGSKGTFSFVLAPLARQDYIWLEEFEAWMRHRRYSMSTIRGYCEVVSTYLRFIKSGIEPAGSEGLRIGKGGVLHLTTGGEGGVLHMTTGGEGGALHLTTGGEGGSGRLGVGDYPFSDEAVVGFTKNYILPRGLSISYQNQAISGLKLFYREVLKRELSMEQVSRPRGEHRLPNVLGKDEIKKLLGVCRNLKHRAMLSTVYGCGLRCGEVLNLRPGDIDADRRLLIVRQGKGNKDRVVPISGKLIELLRIYYKDYRPKVYLFEGSRVGEPYSTRSFQNVLKRAIFLAGIKKSVTLHWLRHSYATHLHESGVDIRYIQEILGHKSSRTTEIYTHVSTRSLERIRSPFDDL